jgi:uncharacterized protein
VNFEWDPPKAAQNWRKHGVSFHEAATVFGDPLSMTYQTRIIQCLSSDFITAGMSSSNRLLIVAHADRGENIRIISARKATRRERKQHEETN